MQISKSRFKLFKQNRRGGNEMQRARAAEAARKKRAEEIATTFIRCGIEARRVQTLAMTLNEPILIDPDDYPGRYRQAIEIIPLD